MEEKMITFYVSDKRKEIRILELAKFGKFTLCLLAWHPELGFFKNLLVNVPIACIQEDKTKARTLV